MVFDSVSEEQKKQFFRQSYAAHLPGYTGHCPTLKFRVGKRFGACTEEIMKELLEKKILKTGPYRPNSGRNTREDSTISYENDPKPDWRNETHYIKTPPYILGYTGYIPGFNSTYGLSFMRAVEEGAKQWRGNQNKLRARRDALRTQIEKTSYPTVRPDNITLQIEHDKKRPTTFHYEITPERPPIVGYTGHIPGAKGESALSKRYAQSVIKGLKSVRKEREQRHSRLKDADAVQRVLDVAHLDELARA
ncbi:protein FAM166B-like isoform X1 [Ceratina calcarata]|uniref:Protein FAM166B-like isoform X1 n=1 Tax=Ceratina calcarata TaxID=156304 RepID=A0AAJ7IZD9_9HYME|nr:protein FAM166B-like isoform X1 [Ceratina calcarata]XP_026669670.1 protein FAM166B-like isoform X1 [Ceratina calcarata]